MRARIYRSSMSKFLTVMSLVLSLPTFSYGLSCSSFFLQAKSLIEPKYGQLKEDFKHTDNYTKIVDQNSNIKNQCNLGTCHLHSWVAQFENIHAARTGENLKLSSHYISYRHWLKVSLRAVEKLDGEISISLGANPVVSRDVIGRFGLMPEEAWKGSTQFHKAPTTNRINEFVRNIIARTRLDIESTPDKAKHREIYDRAKDQIRGVFNNLIGHVDQQFEFRGKIYDPRTFAQEYFPEIKTKVVMMVVNTDRRATDSKIDAGTHLLVRTNFEKIEPIAKQLLDQGHSVYASYEHNGQFVDSSTGIMSIAAFHIPSDGAPLSRILREKYKLSATGHAVQIVGYEADPRTGDVLKWKIKNSWGERSGDGGYYHMYRDYFRAFVRGITFFEGALKKDPLQDGQ